MENAGYKIIKIEHYTEDYAIVLGVNASGQYVTWDSQPKKHSFFWGHYFNNKYNALADYHTRLLAYYNERATIK